ncbi:hypothetical protein SCODD09_01728 [Streptococcus constellatus]|nr:hypothetical protein SCODD09_01728 [Streptococcus constellatus]
MLPLTLGIDAKEGLVASTTQKFHINKKHTQTDFTLSMCFAGFDKNTEDSFV